MADFSLTNLGETLAEFYADTRSVVIDPLALWVGLGLLALVLGLVMLFGPDLLAAGIWACLSAGIGACAFAGVVLVWRAF